MKPIEILKPNFDPTGKLAARITKTASKQTYFTVRFLVDPDRRDEAFRAYAYFRWLDDKLDQLSAQDADRVAIVQREKALMEGCYQGALPFAVGVEEQLLVDLIRSDRLPNSGLQSYIRNMMAVLAFDAERRCQPISQQELDTYTRHLAIAVTEALHYFIGNGSPSPQGETRYMAVTAAHIIHMLRDTVEDTQAGYFNIPSEVLFADAIVPENIDSEPYKAWIRHRIKLAREYFTLGKRYIAHTKNLRCRIAGYAYIARFEGILTTIERDNYRLRPDYREHKNLRAILAMGWSTFCLTLWSTGLRWIQPIHMGRVKGDL